MIRTDNMIWWMLFCQEVFPESRQMSDLEMKDADEFFWSQFV